MKKEQNIFSEETLDVLEELGEVLRRIHNRLLAEGKIIRKDGKTIFLDKEKRTT